MSESADGDGGGFTPDDTEGHEAVTETRAEERREEREQLQQHLSVKERLEQKAAEQTHSVDVLGIPVEFTRLPSDDELELLAIGERFQSLDDDNVAGLRGELQEMRDEVARILADNVVDDDLDEPQWWIDTLSLVDLVMTGAAVAEQNDEVTDEELDGFRDE